MVTLDVNGKKNTVDVSPESPLLYPVYQLDPAGGGPLRSDMGDFARLGELPDPHFSCRAEDRGPSHRPAGRAVARQW